MEMLRNFDRFKLLMWPFSLSTSHVYSEYHALVSSPCLAIKINLTFVIHQDGLRVHTYPRLPAETEKTHKFNPEKKEKILFCSEKRAEKNVEIIGEN